MRCKGCASRGWRGLNSGAVYEPPRAWRNLFLAGAMSALTKLRLNAFASRGLVKVDSKLQIIVSSDRDSLFAIVPVSSSRLQGPWLLPGRTGHGQEYIKYQPLVPSGPSCYIDESL
jgi:hypothetical protein